LYVARRLNFGLPPAPHYGMRYVPDQQVACASALDQVILSAVADGFEGHRFAIGGTEDNYRNPGATAAESQEGVDAPTVGQGQIEQHDVDTSARQAAHRGTQRIGPTQRESGGLCGSVQPLLDQRRVIGIVLDE
jgi:hypothetical protein